MRKQSWIGVLIAIVCAVLVIGAVVFAISHAAAEADKPTPTPMPPVQPWESRDRGLPWGTVHGTRVNFRTGPGTEYESLFQLSTGCAVEVVGEHNGWYQVIRAGVDQPVWVCGDYLEVHDF